MMLMTQVLEAPLIHSSIFMEMLLILSWNTLEPCLKHFWNFRETPFEVLWKPFKLPQKPFNLSWVITADLMVARTVQANRTFFFDPHVCSPISITTNIIVHTSQLWRDWEVATGFCYFFLFAFIVFAHCFGCFINICRIIIFFHKVRILASDFKLARTVMICKIIFRIRHTKPHIYHVIIGVYNFASLITVMIGNTS